MKLIRVGAAVLNQTPLDWDGNAARITGAIADARKAGVSILCLPELCITGYGCEDAFHAPGTQQLALQMLEELKLETRGMAVSVGLPVMVRGSLYNAACLIVDREILGFVAKQNLAGDGIHYEQRWFKPWPAGVRADLDTPAASYPIGDLVFDIHGIRIGFEICEDAWVADRPGADLASRGVDLILNPSASHFAFGKHEIRKRFVIEGSRAFSVGYVYANLLGNEAGRAIYDGDAMIAQAGKLLVTGPRFSYADWHVTHAVVDIDLIRMSRARLGSFRPHIEGIDRNCRGVDFKFPQLSPTRSEPSPTGWEASPHLKEEEFTRAESLALFDYLRKSRSQGFVVSLSGGADSTAVSYLVARLVDFAIAEIGREGLLKKLNHIQGLGESVGNALRGVPPGESVRNAVSGVPALGGIPSENQQLVHRLLACVYQSTRNSGDVTRNAARTVATALGAEYLEFDVDAVVEQYKSLVAKGIGRPLDWQTDDLALQNIQARVRAPSVWMLANLRGALLLSTSNRSEAAVGYATMDGDTSGGLAPIAGIDKAFIRRWLKWCETTGPAGIGPLPELAVVNEQAPTAELRPPGAKQTDEDDLMPYELLDAVERSAIRDKQSPCEILLLLEADFPHYPRQQLATWIERFFRLWSRNQWKRERYAPSFHLDDENLDPKTWCRFPILSGGYERELAELKKLAGR
jgi:NAD+ synthase (glutamine-hydrolysing)